MRRLETSNCNPLSNLLEALALALVSVIFLPVTSSFVLAPVPVTVQPAQRHELHAPQSTIILQQATYPWDGDDNKKLQIFQEEETLLKMHCKCMHGHTLEDNDSAILNKVQKYVQSFPFAAVLPVQPLQYLPTDDGGVEVLFLRKKTQEKGSVDGGIRFFVVPNVDDLSSLEIVVKRYSEGQTVGKMFAEKLVVQAFVAAMTRKPAVGEHPLETKVVDPPTVDAITIESVFHKWMDLET